jgi:hypothetical protein
LFILSSFFFEPVFDSLKQFIAVFGECNVFCFDRGKALLGLVAKLTQYLETYSITWFRALLLLFCLIK